jgi:glycosyltransferase involved in cell wall biosynthesis
MESHSTVIFKSVSNIKNRIVGYVEKKLYKNLYFIGGKQWAYYWVSYYLTKGLKEHLGGRLRVSGSPWDMKLKNQLIHFNARQHFLLEDKKILHESNHVFLTWFHGGLNDEDVSIRQSFEALIAKQEQLSKIIVPCKISEDNLISAGIPSEKLIRIPIGVDLKTFKPTSIAEREVKRNELGILPNDFCIGSFQKDGEGWGEGSKPKWVKGPDVFLEVVEKVHRKYPQILVVLTGPARDFIKSGLEKRGIRYIHKDLEHYPDIVGFYQALDTYLITSRSEGGPKGLIESWACGVPVVSTHVGMSADAIRNGVNGSLVQVDDVNALTQSVNALIENPQQAELMKQNGFKSVIEYDWNKIAGKYYDKVYKPYL